MNDRETGDKELMVAWTRGKIAGSRVDLRNIRGILGLGACLEMGMEIGKREGLAPFSI